MTFILHRGAELVNLNDVRRVPLPDATETFQPVAHGRIYDLVASELDRAGFLIEQEQHGLTRDGARYFGYLECRHQSNPDYQPVNGYSIVVGLRNALDKSMRLMLGLGSRVFVCDNLGFSAEVLIARKHTKKILEDLDYHCYKAVRELERKVPEMHSAVERLRQTSISVSDGYGIITQALLDKVIRPQMLEPFATEWRKPQFDYHTRESGYDSLWGLFNAFTASYRMDNQARELTYPRTTMRLRDYLLDEFTLTEDETRAGYLEPPLNEAMALASPDAEA